jgi:hypothetical protein
VTPPFSLGCLPYFVSHGKRHAYCSISRLLRSILQRDSSGRTNALRLSSQGGFGRMSAWSQSSDKHMQQRGAVRFRPLSKIIWIHTERTNTASLAVRLKTMKRSRTSAPNRLTSACVIRLGTKLVFRGISSDQLDRLRADGPDRKRDIGMSRCQSQRIREWYVPASLLTGI